MCSQAAHTGHFEVCAKGPSENITVQQTLQTAAWFWHMLDTDTSQKKKTKHHEASQALPQTNKHQNLKHW